MFYLKEFFSGLAELRLRGVLLFATSFALALCCAFRPTVTAQLLGLTPEAWTSPYVTALFDQAVSEQDVREQLRGNPLVRSVELLPAQEMSGIFSGLLSRLGAEYKTSGVASFGLRISLASASAAEHEALLERLSASVGADHLTHSGVRTPKVAGLFSGHPVFRYLARFGFAGALVPLFILWALSLALSHATLARRAWLVERFQRRRLVRAKTFAAGAGALMVTALALAAIAQGPDLLGILLMVGIFSVALATTLREQRWRTPQ